MTDGEAPPRWSEAARAQVLSEYAAAGVENDPAIAEIVALAARLTGTAIALVSFVERDRQWFPAHIGLEARETPREQSFCALCMLGDGIMIVPDARLDPRFADNPLVLGPPSIRFYAGVPLRSSEGAPVGSLCVIDTSPRPDLEALQKQALAVLGKQVMAQLELRRLRHKTEREDADFRAMLARTEFVGRWNWDVANDRVSSDAAVAEMFSVDPAELPKGVPFARFATGIHPDDRDRVQEEIAEALASGRDFVSEYRIDRGGDTRWLRASGKPIRDRRGNAVSFPGLVVDISARKIAEEALGTSESISSSLADTIPQLAWMADPDGWTFWFNRRWYDYTGGDFAEMQGRGWQSLIHPAHRERVAAHLAACLAAAEAWEDTFPLRDANGDHRWFLSRALPIRDARGRVLRWFGTCTDIDEARQAAAELDAAQTRLHLALAASEIGIWEVDTGDGSCVWDERTRKLMGFSGEAVAFHRDFLGAAHPQDRAALEEAFQQAIADGTEIEITFRVLPQGGNGRWVLAQGRRLIHGDGSVRLIGTLLDIDAQRSFAEERALVAQELSHRIKNIFAVISGIIGLSVRDYPEARDFAAQLRERLAALGRAHDLVRPQEGQSREAAGQTRLQMLLGELFAPYVQGEEARIRIAGADIAISARAATSLSLLFHELATNATKYGALSQHGGSVAVSASLAGDEVEISWEESGGPAVAGSASHEGFGTRLSRLTVESQLKGRISRHWESGGLRVVITLPRETVLARE